MGYLLYKKFFHQDQALEIQALLKENDIESRLIKPRESLDKIFVGNDFTNSLTEMQLQGKDFELANVLIANEYDLNIDELDKDHYLLKFNDDELYDILLKPDEWGWQDEILAKKILEKRGKKIDDNLINSLRNQRIKDLSQPEKDNKNMVYGGYLFAILGGLFGILFGAVLLTSKKTLPNGDRIYRYSKQDRSHGKIILVISLISYSIFLYLRTSDILK